MEKRTRFPFDRDDLEIPMYDATLGRFLQRDPIGYAGGSPDLYEYVLDNPATNVDPTGETIEICCAPAFVGANRPELPAAGVLNPNLWGLSEAQRRQVRMFNLLPNHCWLKLVCHGKAVLTTEADVGLYAVPGAPWPLRFQFLVHKKWNETEPRVGGTCKACTATEPTCPEESCEVERRCLEKQYKEYPQGRYQLFGSNSNTYAGTVARACCNKGEAEPPLGWNKKPVWAPGWNAKPSPAVPNALPLKDYIGQAFRSLWDGLKGLIPGW
jgi:hypothetical protein